MNIGEGKLMNMMVVMALVGCLSGFSVLWATQPKSMPVRTGQLGSATVGNFEAIHNGMDVCEVREVLGLGDVVYQDGLNIVRSYKTGDTEIHVLFISGQANDKAMAIGGKMVSERLTIRQPDPGPSYKGWRIVK